MQTAISVLGVPFDGHSSFLRGPAKAPDAIRNAFRSSSTNLCTESGLDLEFSPLWKDIGDVTFSSRIPIFESIEQAIRGLSAGGSRPLILGGDHSVTYPIVRALAPAHPGLTVVHLDAHPDLYDEFEGNPHSHACPFARIMEEELAGRLVQIGIRAMTPHQRAQAERFNVEVHEARSWSGSKKLSLKGPVYLSLDMDVLDPAFAPGVSHHEPGGLSTRDVLDLIQSLPSTLVGADIVELNPVRDPSGITTAAAAKFLKEILGKMHE